MDDEMLKITENKVQQLTRGDTAGLKKLAYR